MVKIKKKRGCKKTRSLVFRITRKECKDGIQFDETKSSDPYENSPYPLKIKIPKSLITSSKDKIVLNNSNASCSDANAIIYPSLNTENSYFKEENDLPVRRSSQRILLKVQKQTDAAQDVNGIESELEQLDATNGENTDEIAGVEKKKRGRKPGPRSLAIKTAQQNGVLQKHKPGKRGRPPKVVQPPLVSFNFNTCKPAVRKYNKSRVTKSSENLVWTKIPKELYESEYFQTQIKVLNSRGTRLSENYEVYNRSTEAADSRLLNKERIMKCPHTLQPVTSDAHTFRTNEQPKSKRPLVIYFNSERRNCNQSMSLPFSKSSSLLSGPRSTMDSPCPNRYHEEQNFNAKNYYTSARGFKGNGTLLADASAYKSSGEIHRNTTVLHNNLSGCTVFDFGNKVAPTPVKEKLYYQNLQNEVDNKIDVQTRKLIVESLQILNDSEAVLN